MKGVKVMKIKKIQIVRPEIEVEFVKPILGRLYFITLIPKMFMIKKAKINLCIDSKLMPGCAGHVKTHKIWLVCIPRIRKVIDKC